MKILKVFGIVVGIHVFALILIFANPGCSSTTKPKPADTVTADTTAESSPVVSVPMSSVPAASGSATDLGTTAIVAAPMDYSSGASVRFTPTRPGSSAATAVQGPTPVQDVTPVSTYTVTKGDSLWSIAKKNHISVAELAAANHMKAGTPVHVGQKLIVPGRAPAQATVTTAAGAATKAPESAVNGKATGGAPTKHVVKSGETLGVIARKYGVKVGDIALANNISDPAKIRPGMELMIPGASAPHPAKSSSSETSGANAPATSTPPPVVNEPAKPFFTPPPADRDLDSGIQPGATDAPVIQIEDPNKK